MPFNEATVVVLGKASAFQVQLGAATPSPAVAVPDTTSGAVAVVPVRRQVVDVVVVGQATADRAVSVTPVGFGELSVHPKPNPPETTTGVPELGEVLVAVAMHPPAPVGQVRLASPAIVAVVGAAVIASVVQVSAEAETEPDRTAAAPAVVVPMATHCVDDGQTICESEDNPVGMVSAVKVVAVVGVETIVAPLVP
jgi:hypothetical protein